VTNSPTPPDSLEQWVQRTVRDLPLRAAPPAFTERVQTELARRAALPWWRLSFGQWPMAARAGFVMVCIGVMALIGYVSKTHHVGAAPLHIAQQASATIASASGFVALLLRNIPSSWLLIGAGIGILYTLLFGLGAIAYRTLYLPSATVGDRS
jgi:hypothetical protein